MREMDSESIKNYVIGCFERGDFIFTPGWAEYYLPDILSDISCDKGVAVEVKIAIESALETAWKNIKEVVDHQNEIVLNEQQYSALGILTSYCNLTETNFAKILIVAIYDYFLQRFPGDKLLGQDRDILSMIVCALHSHIDEVEFWEKQLLNNYGYGYAMDKLIRLNPLSPKFEEYLLLYIEREQEEEIRTDVDYTECFRELRDELTESNKSI